MRVVRYTFDVCVRGNISKDTYSLAPTLEKAIASCEGVCGCETVWKGLPGFLTVNVDAAIKWQQRNKKWLDGEDSVSDSIKDMEMARKSPTDDCGNAGGYYGDQPWMYTMIGRPRQKFVELIDCRLTESMSVDYTAEIAEKIADDVAQDICDTADAKNWSDGDLRLAIGRVMLKAVENTYNEEK